MQLAGKRVLITGGSSGIGLATARALLAKRARVLITGRRAGRLSEAVADLRDVGDISSAVADVATSGGRAATLTAATEKFGGLDILINNAGGVRAGRLEDTSEDEIRAMIEVNLLAPILLTRAALPMLRASGDGLIVTVASGIALVGVPFYAVYAGAKAGISRFDEALRRELKGEGVHVLTVYPGATDTPMMQSSRAGPELGFNREPADAVAQAIVTGMEEDAFEVVRGGEARAKMIVQNREDPAAVDERFAGMKFVLAEAVRDHAAL